MPAQPSTEVAQRNPQAELVARVRTEDFRSQVALALPEGESPERFVRVLVTALHDNPELAVCEPGSVFQAALKAAADGLLPDGREAAFVIFHDRKADVDKAQYMPMIAGLRKIAGESAWSIQTAVVYANDEFSYELGLEPKIRHVPVRPGAERGEIIAAYAVGSHRDGRRELEVMTREDVEKVRAVSRAKDRGPWVEWWERMAEKTVGRRLFKKLPLGDPIRQARIVAAAELTAGEASEAIYGPASVPHALGSVDRQTGEILPAPQPAGDGGAAAVASDTPQAEAADAGVTDGAGSAAAATPPRAAASAPEPDDEPEPVAEREDELGDAWNVTVPSGGHAGKTLAEVADTARGEEWLKWAAERPTHENVGPQVHAALQKIRPQLFAKD